MNHIVSKRRLCSPLKTGSVIITSFVTSYAQSQQLELFHKLQNRVLYYDTDSIIYVSNEVKTGSYLGELTSELNKGEWITDFCSRRPKCYSYKTNKGREIMHVKGLNLKGEAKDKFSFEN